MSVAGGCPFDCGSEMVCIALVEGGATRPLKALEKPLKALEKGLCVSLVQY